MNGFPTPNTPELSYNLFAKQGFDLPGRFMGSISADWGWRDDIQWDVLQAPSAIEGSYGLLGAALQIVTEDNRFALKLFSKNLLDQFYTSGIQSNGQFLPPTYRRFLGAEATFTF